VDKAYHVQEFASLTGVTVRALHHYDRLGLLRPRRTGSRIVSTAVRSWRDWSKSWR
jgi:DNA-binding transcriptional MerR regulator